jgi:Na+-driven multidrug efflux pump
MSTSEIIGLCMIASGVFIAYEMWRAPMMDDILTLILFVCILLICLQNFSHEHVDFCRLVEIDSQKSIVVVGCVV